MKQKKQFIILHHNLFFLLFLLICVQFSSCDVKTSKTYQIGILSGEKTFNNIADGFIKKMNALGYIEGKNINYNFQTADFDSNTCKSIIQTFIAEKSDLIFVFPTEPAVIAKEITAGANIPVVFAMAGIESNDLIESISHPGGNITGVRFPGPELTVRRLDILIELVPKTKKVYLIYDKNYPNTIMALNGLRTAASSSGITLVEDPVSNLKELKEKLQKRSAFEKVNMDAILIMPDILNNSIEGFKAIENFANKYNLPIGGGMDFTADLGALFSFVPDNFEQGELAAILANKIIKGTPAGTIMVTTPPAKLRINYKVIQKLNLNISEGLLSRADEIIR